MSSEQTYLRLPTEPVVAAMATVTRYLRGNASRAELQQARDTLAREVGRAVNDGRTEVQEMAEARHSMGPAAGRGAA